MMQEAGPCMNMKDACSLALKKLGLNEVPPYSSNLPQVRKKRREFLEMVAQILRDENAKQDMVVKKTAKLEDFI